MNEEKKIAQAIMDAQKMHQETYDEDKGEHTFDIMQCLAITCTKHGLSTNMPVLLDLTMHWWNDIQVWADDVTAGKNILAECERPPQLDDVIELTDKGLDYYKDLCRNCAVGFVTCISDPVFEGDIVVRCATYRKIDEQERQTHD